MRRIVLILCLFITSAFAESSDVIKREKSLFIQTGFSFHDFDEFNNQVSANGFPKVSDSRFNFVFLLRYKLGKKSNQYLEGDINFYLKDDEGSGNQNISSTGATILLNYLYKKNNFLAVFGAGIGTANITTQNGALTTFNSSLTNPVTTSLNKSSGLVNLGLGYERDFQIKSHNFSWGVRTGYMLSMLKSDWRNPFEKVSAGPDYDFSGAYIRLVLGLL